MFSGQRNVVLPHAILICIGILKDGRENGAHRVVLISAFVIC